MTTALYRRYRPDSFADVIGQEHVTEPLMTALQKNRVNHAYLFSGPRGCGKTTSARILARCLNCAQGPTSTPCGQCESCVELATGGPGSLDVIEIDAASHGGVDDARDLRERASFAPVRDRYKIFIIDEAHMVTSAGFNALLKIVEEPPEHIKFIFATTEPDKVIGTIRSRTHHYPFRLVPPEPLMAYLNILCEREGVAVAPGVLSLVLRAGGGSVRDTLSVLDQLIAGAGQNGLDYELAVSLLGYTHASLLDDVVDALAATDAKTVFRTIDRVIQTGLDPRRFVEDLLERFRDLIIVQALPGNAQSVLRGMPEDQIARMETQATQLGRAELSRAADISNEALNEMTGATSPRLHLELLCARLLLPGAEQGERGMASRLDRIERRLSYAAESSSPAQSSQPAPSVPATQTATAAPAPAAPQAPATTPEPVPEQDPRMTQPRADAEPAPTAAPPRAPEPEDFHDDPWATAAPQSTNPSTPEAPTARTEVQSAEPASSGAAAPAGEGIDMLRRAWPDILDALSKVKRSSWALVSQDATPLSYDDQTLRIGFSTEGLAGRFNSGEHAENLRQAISSTLGLDCRISAGVGTAGGDSPDPKAPAEPIREPAQTQQEPAEPEYQEYPEYPESIVESTGAGSVVIESESSAASDSSTDWPEIVQIPGRQSPVETTGQAPAPSTAQASDKPASAPERTPAPESTATPEAPNSDTPDDTRGENNMSPGSAAEDDLPLSPGERIWSSPAPAEAAPAAEPAPATEPAKRPTPASAPDSESDAELSPQQATRRYDQLRHEADLAFQQKQETEDSRSAGEAETIIEDIPSADDETIEESRLMGRAAVERILGGKLLEERPVAREL
ncbi:DNA polymerase III subunit gamma and tau [Acaricomes phytoseiuli]|uniref:DNA polymerase III subunit gamma and tau n=1 Tax=Acaricomes phytoseiuli TaxID=291968 RepID=UPI00037E424D|nr:DNA polymerase III subunit gamma and tau [Acaricomes phytoseiuli]